MLDGTLDTTPPTLLLTVPTLTNNGLTPLTAMVSDEDSGVPEAAVLTFDVDLNRNGDFADSGELAFASTVVANGTATLIPPSAIPDGIYPLRARVSDAAGNEGVSPVVTMTVDTTPPVVTVYAPPHSNSSSPAGVVSATDEISGLATSGLASLDVDLNGDGDFSDTGETGYASVVLSDGLGIYVSNTMLADGTYHLQARMADQAGNEGVSDMATMEIDTVAPTVELTAPSLTSNATPTVLVTATDTWGLPDGTEVALDVDWNGNGAYADSGETAYLTGTLSEGIAVLTAPTAIANGTYHLRARVSDQATNEGVSDDVTLVIDAAAPAATVATPTVPQSGDVSLTYQLSDSNSDFCSIAVDYSTDGGATWHTATEGEGGDGLVFLDSSTTGTAHTFVWASDSDLPLVNRSNVVLRITPSDSLLGTAGTSGVFAVQNGPEQVVSTSQEVKRVCAGQTFSFDLNYSVSNGDNTLTGLGLRIHYDSQALSFVGLAGVLSNGYLMQQGPVDDTADYDHDSSTDQYILIAWAGLDGQWPNANLAVQLFTAGFTLAANATSGTSSTIRFSAASTAAGYGFSSEPITVTAASVNLDIDGDGTISDATDGALALRYLFGFRGTALTASIAPNADASALAAKLAAATGDLLDVDGNGNADALTDGLLIRRYLSGWTGDALVGDVLAPDAQRTDPAAIADYLSTFLPSTSFTSFTADPLPISSLLSGHALLAAEEAPILLAAEEAPILLAAEEAPAEVLTPYPAQEQIVTPVPESQAVVPGSPVAIRAVYTTMPEDASLSGLGIRVHYDSSTLTFTGLSDVLQASYVQQQPPADDTSDADLDPATDTYVLVAWADAANAWPGEIPVSLFTANFTSASTATDSTAVHFSSSSTTADWSFSATSATVSFVEASGKVSGYVYVDAEQTGRYAANEGLPGVAVSLAGAAQSTTTTDDNGYYEFRDLPVGSYTITEKQPAACLPGGEHTLSAVSLASGQTLSDQNFREVGLRPQYISNRLLAASTQPAGSAAWTQAIRDVLTRAEVAASGLASSSLTTSVTSQSLQASPQTVSAAQTASTEASVSPTATSAVSIPQSAVTPAASQGTTAVSSTALQPIIDAAIQLWADAGLPTKAVETLKEAAVSVADLPTNELGWTSSQGIVIDADAAGYGWFIDPTPSAAEEFRIGTSATERLATTSMAANHMDLLTVVAHELGHYLGLDDTSSATTGLMSAVLAKGVRRTPGSAEIDALLANPSTVEQLTRLGALS